MSGVDGAPVADWSTGAITGWAAAPFAFSRAEFISGESFIKHDGILLMGLEALGRTLHPFLAVEAENFTTALLVTGGTPLIQSNNEHNGSPATDRLNGGLSVMGLMNGDLLTFTGLLPPEPYSNMIPNTYHYRTRLRASNAGGANTTVTLTITQGTTIATRTFAVPPTGDVHEYVMVDDGTGFSLPLLSATSFSFTCSTGSPGPCAIDDFVFESDGNGT